MTEPSLDRAVVVTLVRLDRPEVRESMDSYRTHLTPEERAREGRFFRDVDRERFVVARAVARLQLSRFGRLAPGDWRFETNGHGRPEVSNSPPDGPRLRFNISHTNGLVAVAIAGDREVGVDVEWVSRGLTHDVAGRFFAPREVADLRSLPAEDQPRVFFDYWTLKEAYIKARGLGLALPLHHFAFVLSPPARPLITFDQALPDDPQSWQFIQGWPTPEHRLGLAIRRTGPDLDVVIEDTVPRVDA